MVCIRHSGVGASHNYNCQLTPDTFARLSNEQKKSPLNPLMIVRNYVETFWRVCFGHSRKLFFYRLQNSHGACM